MIAKLRTRSPAGERQEEAARLPVDHPEMRDFARAAGSRRLADEIGVFPAVLAHRYALSLDVDTLVLGVKNRTELAECAAAAAAGPLPPELIARVDQTVAPLSPA